MPPRPHAAVIHATNGSIACGMYDSNFKTAAKTDVATGLVPDRLPELCLSMHDCRQGHAHALRRLDYIHQYDRTTLAFISIALHITPLTWLACAEVDNQEAASRILKYEEVHAIHGSLLGSCLPRIILFISLCAMLITNFKD